MRFGWCLPIFALLAIVVSPNGHAAPLASTESIQRAEYLQQRVLDWAQKERRLPCPAPDETMGDESCTAPHAALHSTLEGTIPWGLLGLHREQAAGLQYAVPQAYTQPAILDRIDPHAICHDTDEAYQDAANELAFQIQDASGNMLAGGRRWHLLPHLAISALPSVFFGLNGKDGQSWSTRCGMMVFPQAPLQENAPALTRFISQDGVWMAVQTKETLAIWKRDGGTWEMEQKIPTQESGVLRQVLFAPDNRWMILLDAAGKASYWPWSEDDFKAAAFPAEWNGMLNHTNLEHISISPNGQWLTTFEKSGMHFWHRANGGWAEARFSESSNEPHRSGHVLRWLEQAQPSLWIERNGIIRRYWLMENEIRPDAAFLQAAPNSAYLPAPDGSPTLMEAHCGEFLTLTRFARLGARYLPVAQNGPSHGCEAGAWQFGWEIMPLILAVQPDEAHIEALSAPTPPEAAPAAKVEE